MNNLTLDKNGFYLDGEPFRIISGDIHYFRIHRNDWEKRLRLAVDFGLNTVQTYVPWNAHEPSPGRFDFSGMLDLGEFLRLCGETGLKVLLRPSPYICSELDLGGLPAWLLKDRELIIRSSNKRYLDAVKRYYDRLIPEFLPYLATNGGPVIAVAVENEYGDYGNDAEYLKSLAAMLRERGVNVPLYTTDPAFEPQHSRGSCDECDFFGVNFRAKPGETKRALDILGSAAKGKPFFIGEFWAGRAMHWGEPFWHRPPSETAEALREALELNANINLYMFSGGTNFGPTGGANMGLSFSPRPKTPSRYIPQSTSYNADTMLGEDGEPTEKYFLCRDVLDEYFGREKRPHVVTKHRTQAAEIALTESAELFDNLDALTETREYSAVPKPMEDLGQSYGLTLYTTELSVSGSCKSALKPYEYCDRASVYVDKSFFASFLRDRGLTKTADGVSVYDEDPLFEPKKAKHRIDVLTENLGRTNWGKEMPSERKGLTECMLFMPAKLFGYEQRTLPLNDLSRIAWEKNERSDNSPRFFKGSFDAETGVDTYVSFEGFGHGYIYVNGFNIGRYDGAGPQLTLYLPGHLLKEKENEIIILDIAPKGKISSVSLIDHEMLEGEGEELS